MSSRELNKHQRQPVKEGAVDLVLQIGGWGATLARHVIFSMHCEGMVLKRGTSKRIAGTR